MTDQPKDFVDSSERLSDKPQAERRPDQGGLILAYLFAVAGLIIGFVSCFLWMTV